MRQLQRRVKTELKDTQTGKMLVLEFGLGPIRFVCLVNVPKDGETRSTSYVKVDLDFPEDSWEDFEG